MDSVTSRMALAEMRIDQHEKLHEETHANLRLLSDGINALVQAEVRREGDEKTFGRIFTTMKEMQTDVTELRKDFEGYKDSVAGKELAAYKAVVWKVIGLASIVIASVIAGHFGGKWLG